jgi:hypothetical protein
MDRQQDPSPRWRDEIMAAIARRVAIDLRALAAFRMALGTLLIVDLLMRSRGLVAFYSDDGVLPREAFFASYSNAYSLHAISGEVWVQAGLFVVAGLFAAAMVFGYRTRVATVVSWLLLLSLRNRNPMVLNSGDTLLALLCFWAIFLPLGERWAVDGRRIDRDRSSVASVATLALLLQVTLMYATNAIHKGRSEEWMSGEAVTYIFQADQFTRLLGNTLATHHVLLEWVTLFWVALLFLSPLLVLLTGRTRALLVTLFVGIHLGMLATMQIGVFPLVAVAALLPFYPASVWDAGAALTARTGIAERLGTVRAHAAATIGSLVGNAPGRTIHRARTAHFTRWSSIPSVRSAVLARLLPVSCRLERGRDLLVTVVPALFVVLVLLSNAAAVGYTSVPESADRALEATDTEQGWGMFAPDPVRTTRWFAAPGTLANGSEVDVLHESPVTADRPTHVETTYPSARWRKYLSRVRYADNTNHRSYLANYLCERWNRRHDTSVETVSLWGLDELVEPYNGTTSSNHVKLIEYECNGPLLQG